MQNRQKVILGALLCYWLAAFVFSHIPIPQIVYRADISDKRLHCIEYLILVFLIWFSIGPDRKVNWYRPAAWLVFFATACYAGMDEWLQGYVGRTPDIMDFTADIIGALLGLILFSFFTFRSALLFVMGVSIFLLTNLARADISALLPVTNTIFHFIAFGFFTLIWLRLLRDLLPAKAVSAVLWPATAILPAGLLLAAKLVPLLSGRSFDLKGTIASLAGIAVGMISAYLAAKRPF